MFNGIDTILNGDALKGIGRRAGFWKVAPNNFATQDVGRQYIGSTQRLTYSRF